MHEEKKGLNKAEMDSLLGPNIEFNETLFRFVEGCFMQAEQKKQPLILSITRLERKGQGQLAYKFRALQTQGYLNLIKTEDGTETYKVERTKKYNETVELRGYEILR